jgi:hypothetical protein
VILAADRGALGFPRGAQSGTARLAHHQVGGSGRADFRQIRL